MILQKKTLNFLSFAQTKYVIPFFQRAYVWKEEEWRNLLSTLLESDDNNHFLGSLIFKDYAKNDYGKKIRDVIDGQQRLTTLLILSKVCLDRLKEADEKNKKEGKKEEYTEKIKKIYKLLFFRANEDDIPDETSELKLTHSINDECVFDKVMKSKKCDDEDKKSQIYKCYDYFNSKIPQDGGIVIDVNKAKQIVQILLKEDGNMSAQSDEKDYLFIVIDLSEEESEQRIFNVINSQGEPLTSAEIIKNSIYDSYKRKAKPKDKGKEYFEKTWGAVFEQNNTTINFWKNLVGTGVQAKHNIDLLLQYVAVIKGIYTPDLSKNNKLEKLHSYFKDYIENADKEKITEFINEIMKYGVIYKTIFDDINNIVEYKDINKRLAHIVLNSGAMTLCPYLLKIYYDESKIENDDFRNIAYELPNVEKLVEKLKSLESLIIRYILIAENNSKIKNFNKKIAPIIRTYSKNINFINEIIKDEKNNNAKIKDEDLREGIKYIKNNKYAKLVLYWMTMYLERKRKEYKFPSITFNCSLEHVMPQKYEDAYPLNKYPVYKCQEKGKWIIYENKEGKEIREKNIYSIGNMTICMKAANSSYSNLYIKEKMEGKGGVRPPKNSTYTENEHINITREIRTIYEKNKNKKRPGALWDERDIMKREQDMYDRIIEIWPMNTINDFKNKQKKVKKKKKIKGKVIRN